MDQPLKTMDDPPLPTSLGAPALPANHQPTSSNVQVRTIPTNMPPEMREQIYDCLINMSVCNAQKAAIDAKHVQDHIKMLRLMKYGSQANADANNSVMMPPPNALMDSPANSSTQPPEPSKELATSGKLEQTFVTNIVDTADASNKSKCDGDIEAPTNATILEDLQSSDSFNSSNDTNADSGHASIGVSDLNFTSSESFNTSEVCIISELGNKDLISSTDAAENKDELRDNISMNSIGLVEKSHNSESVNNTDSTVTYKNEYDANKKNAAGVESELSNKMPTSSIEAVKKNDSSHDLIPMDVLGVIDEPHKSANDKDTTLSDTSTSQMIEKSGSVVTSESSNTTLASPTESDEENDITFYQTVRNRFLLGGNHPFYKYYEDCDPVRLSRTRSKRMKKNSSCDTDDTNLATSSDDKKKKVGISGINCPSSESLAASEARIVPELGNEDLVSSTDATHFASITANPTYEDVITTSEPSIDSNIKPPKYETHGDCDPVRLAKTRYEKKNKQPLIFTFDISDINLALSSYDFRTKYGTHDLNRTDTAGFDDQLQRSENKKDANSAEASTSHDTKTEPFLFKKQRADASKKSRKAAKVEPKENVESVGARVKGRTRAAAMEGLKRQRERTRRSPYDYSIWELSDDVFLPPTPGNELSPESIEEARKFHMENVLKSRESPLSRHECIDSTADIDDVFDDASSKKQCSRDIRGETKPTRKNPKQSKNDVSRPSKNKPNLNKDPPPRYELIDLTADTDDDSDEEPSAKKKRSGDSRQKSKRSENNDEPSSSNTSNRDAVIYSNRDRDNAARSSKKGGRARKRSPGDVTTSRNDGETDPSMASNRDPTPVPSKRCRGNSDDESTSANIKKGQKSKNKTRQPASNRKR